MTDSKTLDRFEALCRNGASFEQALAETGLADTPLSMAAMLFKYWKMLQMEHAFDAARTYYDRLIAEEIEAAP